MFISHQTVAEYLSFCRFQKNLDGKSIKAYGIDLRQYLVFNEEAGFEDERARVLSYLEHLHGAFRPRTVKRKIASLKAFFSYCLDFEVLESNPFGKISVKYSTPIVLPRTIPREDVWTLLQAAHTLLQQKHRTEFQRSMCLRDVAILELLFATGVRVSELCGLSKRDLNTHDKSLRIMGKGDKQRILQVTHPTVLELLDIYMSEHLVGIEPVQPMFYTRNGGRISEAAVRRIILKYAELAGIIDHLTPHMFRHTFATLLLEEGVDIRYIQHMLGHSNIATTQIYTHVAAAKQRNILETHHPRNSMNIG